MQEEPRTRLIAALETILDIDASKLAGVAEARQGAEKMGQYFQSAMQAKLRGDTPAERPPDLLKSRLAQMSSVMDDTRRREEAFMDALDQLMRLWADEPKRAAVEEIFQALREMRMLNFADIGTFAPRMEGMAMPGEGENLLEARKRMLASFADWQGQMHEQMKDRFAAQDALIERSHDLLKKALALAKSL